MWTNFSALDKRDVGHRTESNISGQILVKLLNLKYPPETPPLKKEKVFMSLHCLDHKKKKNHFWKNFDKQSENDSDVKDITEYNHISIRMYNFSLN